MKGEKEEMERDMHEQGNVGGVGRGGSLCHAAHRDFLRRMEDAILGGTRGGQRGKLTIRSRHA